MLPARRLSSFVGFVASLLLAAPAAPVAAQRSATRAVVPMIASPEVGLDDAAAYQGYQTRFFRDARDNTLQIYVDGRSGRVVHLWADAENESIGFTVRDGNGRPAPLQWATDTATVGEADGWRTLAYELSSERSALDIGWFLLGSMRVERDLQYAGTHRAPFGAPFRLPELVRLVADIQGLDATERRRHVAQLGAQGVDELRARLTPRLSLDRSDTATIVRVTQPSFDGVSHLALELRVRTREATARVTPRGVSIRAIGRGPLRLGVRVATDAASLSPLSRESIFNAEFLRFLDDARANAASGGDSAVLRYRWLERQVRGVELLSTREKLMAGLPNFATYFGRDMMMTALMMTPIWSGTMGEHVIGSVLRKLGPAGDVSHEEALGGQAIRESAAEYHALITDARLRAQRGEAAKADSLRALARVVLRSVRVVRENYNMRDDELQLPVVAARYLRDTVVSAERKRAFLLDSSDGGGTRVARLLRELELVARLTAPYVREAVATNLVEFPRRDSTWASASWRDSNAGYAGGRFAMDINVIWAPQALQGIGEIVDALRDLGLLRGDSVATATLGPLMSNYLRDPALIARARQVWSGTARHFVVRLDATTVRERVQAKLAWLPAGERRHWSEVLAASGADREPLEFLALALDGEGRPIPVVNTDPATQLFLASLTAGVPDGPQRTADVLRDAAVFTRPFPVGLFVREVGPLVANDAYAPRRVWERFAADLYHSPRVVWGREVNLICLGLANQISAAYDGSGRLRDPSLASYVRTLREALQRTLAAVDASGLAHNELWSYRIEGNRVLPVRYGSSSDVQLWNTTNLAVQFALSRLPPP